jgi:hypothetical protein
LFVIGERAAESFDTLALVKILWDRHGLRVAAWLPKNDQIRSVLIKPALIGSHLGWSTIAVPGDEPGFVVASGKLDERGSFASG